MCETMSGLFGCNFGDMLTGFRRKHSSKTKNYLQKSFFSTYLKVLLNSLYRVGPTRELLISFWKMFGNCWGMFGNCLGNCWEIFRLFFDFLENCWGTFGDLFDLFGELLGNVCDCF